MHIAIIPDGNRRWAKKQGLLAWKGHEKSGENFHDLVEWARRDGRITVLSFWCFSTENWKRDASEVEKLMELLEKYLNDERENLRQNKIHLIHSGRRDRIPHHLMELIDAIDTETKTDPSMTLHLMIDYGGKDEVLRALGSITDEDLTDDLIRAHLDHPELPDMDLIIRTSGEQRTSNFALWQSTYAEWMFSPKLFPEFEPEDLSVAIDEFSERKRRFGA